MQNHKLKYDTDNEGLFLSVESDNEILLEFDDVKINEFIQQKTNHKFSSLIKELVRNTNLRYLSE